MQTYEPTKIMFKPSNLVNYGAVLALMSLVYSVPATSAEAIKISEERLQQHVDQLSKIGNLGPKLEDGFTRAAWSDEETKGLEYFKKEGEKMGLEARYDGIGNLYLRTKNNSNYVIQTGSHIDTVPAGGTFDGQVGILGGLEALRGLMEAGAIPPDKDVELVLWRGEESATYQFAYKGSKAAWGDKMPDDLLSRKFNGVTLEDNIKKQGFDPSFIRDNKPANPEAERDKIKAYIELHVEQANKLESDGDDIGVVTSIRGGTRYKVEVTGRFDHSGGTPMGTKYRRDANLTMATMQVELDKLMREHHAKGVDLVQTVGVINTDAETNKDAPLLPENALTKVSGYGYFFIDIRGNNRKTRDAYAEEARATLQAVAKNLNTIDKISNLGSSDPAEKLDTGCQKLIEAAAKRRGYKYQYIVSGAGHDAAVVANQKNSAGEPVPVCMIFVPSKNGVSHDKDEFTKTSDIRKGTEVLADTISMLLKR